MSRNYSNTASQASLSAAIGAADTTIQLATFTGYPAVPFTAAIARGTANEEIVLVTAVTSNSATVTRGYDGTTAIAQGAGSTFQHVIVAQDMRDVATALANASAAQTAAGNAQTTANAAAPQTSLDTHTAATAAHGATGAVVGTTNTQTLTNKTLTTPTINTPTINTPTIKAPTFQTSGGAALAYVDASTVGAASGVASLDATGKVPAAQIPSSGTSAPIVAIKSADQQNTGGTSYADATGLLLTIPAAGTYAIDGLLWETTTASGNSAFTWTVTGTLSAGVVTYGNNGGANAFTSGATGIALAVPGTANAVSGVATFTTSGSLQLRFAQTSGSGNATMKAGSFVRATKIG